MKKSLCLMTLLAALTVTASIFADDEEVWRLKPGEEREITINGKPGKIICEEAQKPRLTVRPVKIKKNTVYGVILDEKTLVETHTTIDDAVKRVKELEATGSFR